MIRCWIVPLTFAAVAIHAGEASAQGALPAPLPGQAVAPASGASPFPRRRNQRPPGGLHGWDLPLCAKRRKNAAS